MSPPSQCLRLEQARTAFDAGGLSGARIVAAGSRFYVALDIRAGAVAVLVRHADQSPRYFSDAGTALRLLHNLGFRAVACDLDAWEPGQQSLA